MESQETIRGGVWLFNTDNSPYTKVVHGWYVVGTNVISQRDLLIDFGWPTGNSTYNFLRGALSLPSDSIVVAFQHKGSSWTGGNNTDVTTFSDVRFCQSSTVVGLDTAYIREPRDDGWVTDVAGLGSNQSEIFVLLRRVYRYWPVGVLTFLHYYNGYLLSGTSVDRRWNNVIPRLDNPSVYYSPPNGASISQGARQIAIAWVTGDTLLVRILDSLIWFKASSCIDSLSDGSRRNPKVHVTSDSVVYLAFNANRNGRQHAFLARFRPDYIVDSVLTAVNEQEGYIPNEMTLLQNYPNPFNPSTTIKFQIPYSSLVTLKIFDLLGREVSTMINEDMKPGSYEKVFDGSGLASGVYLYL